MREGGREGGNLKLKLNGHYQLFKPCKTTCKYYVHTYIQLTLFVSMLVGLPIQLSCTPTPTTLAVEKFSGWPAKLHPDASGYSNIQPRNMHSQAIDP